MKKFLSLVLALVMAMSLVTVSAGAEYADAADIKYDEAVAVLSALDIVGGSNNKFMPNGTLTRGAAAKIITNLAAGPDAVLDATASEFSDVAAGSTFAKYINYLAGEGIVGGYSDGTYRPSAGQSGYAYLKMLLGVIGYSSEVEGYSGSGWQARALNDATEAGLLKGMKGFVPGNTITRDNAAMLAFNALKATMVEYDGGLNVTTGDTTITVGAERKNIGEYGETTTDGYNKIEATPYTQYVEKKFEKLLKKTASGDYTADAFGRANDYVWELDGEVVYVAAPELAAVYTAAVDSSKTADMKAFRAGLEKAGVEFAGKNADGYYFAGAVTSVKNGAPDVSVYYDVDLADLLANGKTVEVYVNDETGAVTDVIVVDYSIGTADVTVNDDGDVTYYVNTTNYYDYADNTYDDDTAFVVGTVKDGDVVTYVEIGSECYIWATTVVTGAQASKTGTKITVGGKQYTLQYNEAGNIASYANSTTAKKYYLDQFGYVVDTAAVAATSSTDVLYVLKSFVKTTESLNGFTVTATIKAILADGTIGEYDVVVEKAAKAGTAADGTAYYKKAWVMGDMLVGDKWCVGDTAGAVKSAVQTLLAADNVYAYTKSGDSLKLEFVDFDGTYADGDLYYEAIADLDAATVDYSNGNFVDKKTVFVVYDRVDDKTTVYTGSVNLPDFASTVNGVAVAKYDADNSRGVASVVFAFDTDGVNVKETEEYVYVKTSSLIEALVDGEDVNQYTGTYANGKTLTLTDPDGLVLGNALYTFNEKNEVTGAIDLTTANDQYLEAADLTLKNGILTVEGGASYFVTSETDTLYVDANRTKVDGSNGIVVLKVVDDVITADVEAIFVVGSAT